MQYKKDDDANTIPSKSVLKALNKLEYSPSDEMLEDAMNQLLDPEDRKDEQVSPPTDVDLDQFVHVLDFCRKASSETRRKMAGYSDEEIKKYREAFAVYDEDSSGDIEKHELTKLLLDLGISMRTKAEQ